MLGCSNQAMKKKLDLNYVEGYMSMIKDFKVWSDQHAPSVIKPVLSYALDWLAPELLGTGFTIKNTSEESVQAKIPFQKSNCDFHNQIHTGLVVNGALEVISTFISRHWAKNLWEVKSQHIQLSKNLKWNKDLELTYSCSEEETDKFILALQKNDHVTFEGTVLVSVKNSGQSDSIHLKLNISKLKLLS
jgi:hypothetical protein